MFGLYVQAKSETPPSGHTICHKDALISFFMCSNENETAHANWVHHELCGSSGIVGKTSSSSLLNDCTLHFD